MSEPGVPRDILQLLINPTNGTLVALAHDGTLWLHEGSIGAHTKEWKQVRALPPITPATEENEDDITKLV